MENSSGDGEDKLENSSTEIAAKASLVRAVDSDDMRLAGLLPVLYLNNILLLRSPHGRLHMQTPPHEPTCTYNNVVQEFASIKTGTIITTRGSSR